MEQEGVKRNESLKYFYRDLLWKAFEEYLFENWKVGQEKFGWDEDWTENGIATDLVRAGVCKEDIVLAFYEPKMRQYTEFVVAS